MRSIKRQYDEYVQELETRSAEFNRLIDNAFSPDFRTMLTSSANLALSAGVSEDLILDSMDKVDDYFS